LPIEQGASAVVDTLSQWADLRGDMENQAGDAFAALQPLQQAAGEGIAVIFLQHERKSGGDAADAGRGSSAFAGAVATLVGFRRPLGDVRGNLRLLLALSRFEAVPPELYASRATTVAIRSSVRALTSLRKRRERRSSHSFPRRRTPPFRCRSCFRLPACDARWPNQRSMSFSTKAMSAAPDLDEGPVRIATGPKTRFCRL
jgi:hypothetical protein